MITSNKIECFIVSPSETFLFAGNNSGQIHTLDPKKLNIISSIQAHAGNIHAIIAHPTYAYVAALSADRRISIWRWDSNGNLSELFSLSIRGIVASNDEAEIESTHSLSQAIAFHPSLRRLATRNGSAAIVEIEFDDDGEWKILHATRIHGDEDLVTVRYTGDGTQLLSGSIRGEVALSDNGIDLKRWRFGDRSIHWFEPIANDVYLLASDMRYVIRLNVSSGETVIGPQFTKDDLEHVTYSLEHNYAVVTGFDKNIYKLDPSTCIPIEIIYKAAFKCRWAAFLKSDNDAFIFHSFDGGLYRLSLTTGQCVSSIKETPFTIWSGTRLSSKDYAFAGEGNAILNLCTHPVDNTTRLPKFCCYLTEVDAIDDGYVKRFTAEAVRGLSALARTDGTVLILRDNVVVKKLKIDGVIRDAVWSTVGSQLFICTEAGQLHRIDPELKLVDLIFESPRAQPFWALDIDATSGTLAVAERRGKVCLLSSASFQLIDDSLISIRPKRIKWDGVGRLLLNIGDKIDRFSPASHVREPYLPSVGNTIEDFAWDDGRRYLVAIGYRCDIYLCDYESGELLHTVADQIDYSKGIMFLAEVGTSYPLHFVTYGRSGCVHLFRIHNERIHALGAIASLNEVGGNRFVEGIVSR